MEISLGSGLHRAGQRLLLPSFLSALQFRHACTLSPLFVVDFSLLRLLGEGGGEAIGWSRGERGVVQAKGVAG